MFGVREFEPPPPEPCGRTGIVVTPDRLQRPEKLRLTKAHRLPNPMPQGRSAQTSRHCCSCWKREDLTVYKSFYSAFFARSRKGRICLKNLVGPEGFEPPTKGL